MNLGILMVIVALSLAHGAECPQAQITVLIGDEACFQVDWLTILFYDSIFILFYFFF